MQDTTTIMGLDARLLRFRTGLVDTARRTTADEAAMLARELLAQGRFREALEVTRTALESFPDHPALLCVQGRAHYAARELLSAQRCLLEAARGAPGDPEPFRWLGEVLMKRGEPERAERALERAVALGSGVDGSTTRLLERARRLGALARASAEGELAPLPVAEAPATTGAPEIALPTEGVRGPGPAGGDVEAVPSPDGATAGSVTGGDVADAAIQPVSVPGPRRGKRGVLWVAAALLGLAALGAAAYGLWWQPRRARIAATLERVRPAVWSGDPVRLREVEPALRDALAVQGARGEAARLLWLSAAQRAAIGGDARLVQGKARELGLIAPQETAEQVLLASLAASLQPDDLQAALPAVRDDAEASLVVGLAALRVGLDAAAPLEAALRTAPNLHAARVALAQLALDRDEAARALERLAPVLEAQPAHLPARLWTRVSAHRAGRAPADDASAQLDALEDALHGADVQGADAAYGMLLDIARAQLAAARGDAEAARQHLSQAAAREVSAANLLALLAREAWSRDVLSVAEPAARQAVQKAPAAAGYRRLLAKVLLAKGERDEALEVMRGAPAQQAQDLALQLETALAVGDPQVLGWALEAFEAYVSAGGDATAQLQALRLRIALRHAGDAETQLQRARALRRAAPAALEPVFAFAEAALAAGQPTEALTALEAHTGEGPRRGEALWLLGRALHAAGKTAAAERQLEQAQQAAPGLVEAQLTLAEVALDRGRYEEARKRFAAVAAHDGDAGGDPRARLGQIRAQLAAGRLDDAAAAIQALPQALADSLAGRTLVARLALRQGDTERALEALAPVDEAPHADATALATRGDAWFATSEIGKAAAAYVRAVERDPHSVRGWLGRVEVELRGERAEQAVTYAERAIEALAARPHPPALRARVLEAQGRAYLLRRQGEDRERARQVLTEASKLAGARSSVFFWLGEAHAGRYSRQARQAYERFLALEPEGELAERARRAIGPRP